VTGRDVLARPTAGLLLRRLLETPGIEAAIRSLDGRALGRIIENVGLEDAGEIVAFATAGQLERVFDGDLWRSAAPGQDEAFDAERFALWVEVLLEHGDDFAAGRVAAMSEDLVALALHRLLLVLDADSIAVGLPNLENGRLIDKALESAPTFELDELLLVGLDHRRFDVVTTLLVALDKEHRDLLRRLLERLRDLDDLRIEEDGGLYEVLSAGESLAEDVAGEREDRRAREGYVAPSLARSFLARARLEGLDDEPDPVARIYFREFEPRAGGPAATGGRAALAALPEGIPGDTGPGRAGRLTAALAVLLESDPEAHDRVLAELSFLANALVAGHGVRGRALRPAEAASAALEICELGLGRKPWDPARVGAVALFRRGWRLLHDPPRRARKNAGDAAPPLRERLDIRGAKAGRDPEKAGR
jgi:hypothetical protein